jgi:anti-sigma-K factor RskA
MRNGLFPVGCAGIAIMRDSRIEELISAYVDGELSSDERLLVERELDQSTESRQLFERLRLQRRMLQSLPRVRLSRDFSNKVIQRIEASKVARPSPETRESRKSGIRRQALNVVLGIGSVLAAGLLITMVLHDSKVETNPLLPPVVEQPNVDPQLRLAAFEKQFGRFLMVYELSVTPKGRQNKTIEKWFQAANLDIKSDTLPIEGKLEKGLLESRFIANDLIPIEGGNKDASATDVEMVLIRNTASAIDGLLLEWYKMRAAANDEVSLKSDLVLSTKELEIFLNLNDAVDGGSALRQVSSDTWTTPGAYRLKFRFAFNRTQAAPKVSTTGGSNKIELPIIQESTQTPPVNFALNGGEKSKPVVQLQPQEQPEQQPNTGGPIGPDRNDKTPSQVLIIIRHLNDNYVFPAVKGTAGK